ncbi:MAG: sigma-70 family RNA polymerase sigma factor [Candidatus Solibacter usitatus]|nr:sigma-70 family RNA polymerase sigma factor [Candidatus Solibacter usitatus]
MSPDATAGTTQLLLAWSQGDEDAREQLLPFVYDELKKLARGQMRRERSNHTLEVTGLVHEVYLLMIDQKRVSWQNRAHFFGIAAQMMRRVLVNHAVARQAQKRGGKRQQITLREDAAVNEQRSVDLLTLDQALKELESLDPRQCRVVELRYFAGLSNEEMAEALGISLATVKREWATARLWLHRRIRGKVEDET